MESALVLKTLGYAVVPTVTAMMGAVAATFRPPSSKARSYIQHLAAGVVFSVVAVELLPDITHRHLPIPIAIGFSLGVAAMLGLKALTSGGEGGHAKSPATLLWGVVIDVFIDGLLLALTFAEGAKAGRLLALALATEMLSLGLAVAAALGAVGYRRGRALATSAAVFSALLLGALTGSVAAPLLTGAFLEGVLSFGLAALLFLVTEELLVEAHAEGEIPGATALFFAGFLFFLLLGMM